MKKKSNYSRGAILQIPLTVLCKVNLNKGKSETLTTKRGLRRSDNELKCIQIEILINNTKKSFCKN
jgi:hypothetical protein